MLLKKVLALSLSASLLGLPLNAPAADPHKSITITPTSPLKTASLKGHYSPGYLELNNEKFAVTKTRTGQQSVYSMQSYSNVHKSYQVKLKKLKVSTSVSGNHFIEYLAVTESGKHIVTVERTPPPLLSSHSAYPHLRQQSSTVPLDIKKSITASGSVVYTTVMPDGSAIRIKRSHLESSHHTFSNNTIKNLETDKNRTVTKDAHPTEEATVKATVLSAVGAVVLVIFIVSVIHTLEKGPEKKDPESPASNARDQEDRGADGESQHLLPLDNAAGGGCMETGIVPPRQTAPLENPKRLTESASGEETGEETGGETGTENEDIYDKTGTAVIIDVLKNNPNLQETSM